MPITPLPTPVPNRGMSEEDFANAGDNFLGALPTFATELNTLQTDVTNKQTTASTAATTATTQATNASASATSASASATTASNWAIKSGSAVSGSDWSAKEHAVGTSVTTGSAKDWATKTGGLVASTDYSAKYYAQSAQTAAAAAGAAAGLPSLTGNAGKVLAVNALATGVEWSSSAAPIGDVVITANSLSAPQWLPCDGSTYSVSSYPTLSGKLGWLMSKSGHSAVSSTVNPKSITFGNGLWVAATSDGIKTSTDGVSWTTRTTPPSGGLTGGNVRGVAFGNGVFVAVGDTAGGGAVTSCFTSTDGITWTARTIPSGAYNDVAYTSGGGFMAIGGNGSSPACAAGGGNDGVTWTAKTIPTGRWQKIAGCGGNFSAVSDTGQIAFAQQQNSFTTKSVSGFSPTIFYDIASSEDSFTLIAISNTKSFAISTDRGITWKTGEFPTTSPQATFQAIDYVSPAGGWLAASSGSQVFMYYSMDGINWSQTKSEVKYSFVEVDCIGNNGKEFVAGTSTSTVARKILPLGYTQEAGTFATPQIIPSLSGGVKAYIRAN